MPATNTADVGSLRSLMFALGVALVPVVLPSTVSAQVPKLDIKVFAGPSTTTFVSLVETGRERDTFVGWQLGLGGRLRFGHWFVEGLLSFNRWAFRADVDELDAHIKGRVNSFEFPINAGYIPFQNPFFRLYLYGGFVNYFNTRILATVEVPGEPSVGIKLRPKEASLAIYQALARFGVSTDLAMFNIDFNYSISLNSATKTSYRTSYHQLQLNIAYLF